MNKLRVGLFLGGKSSEREISLESARHVYNNLDTEKYDITLLFMDSNNAVWEIGEPLLWMNTTVDIVAKLEKEGSRIYYEDLKNLLDFAFIAMHGKYAEDAMQGLLEILNIPNNGAGVLGGALSMDKAMQKILLTKAGLFVPQYAELLSSESLETADAKISKSMGYPCIIKPSREGSSSGVSRVNDKNQLKNALDLAFKHDNIILAEEILIGMEVTTAVIQTQPVRALLPTQTPAKGDFLTAQEKFLPGDARMITPPDLPEETIKLIQESCVRAFEALNLQIYSRIDGFWTGKKFVILEPNNPPAMTPSTALWHQVAEDGSNSREFLSLIIDLALVKHKEKKGPL